MAAASAPAPSAGTAKDPTKSSSDLLERDLGPVEPCSVHGTSGYATCECAPRLVSSGGAETLGLDVQLCLEMVLLLAAWRVRGGQGWRSAATSSLGTVASAVVGWILGCAAWRMVAERVSKRSCGVESVWEQVRLRNRTRAEKERKVAVIGTGISGLQAIKSCLAEPGVVPICFEADGDIGGFWRYKESRTVPSIYKSTHIDTDRDLAGYMDIPWNANTQLTIRNDKMLCYLRDNIKLLNLDKYIRFNTKVLSVTPHEKHPENGWTWKICSCPTEKDPSVKENVTEEIFDGVMIASGRHGGGAYLPPFPGLNETKVEWMHSSQFKDPDTHNLKGKVVVVVGVGNSGIDIVTEVSPIASKCFLVSRSGVWVTRLRHGDWAFSEGVGDRLTMSLFLSLPWMIQTELFERFGLFFQSEQQKDQEILNRHGLKPTHRFWQQHTILSGLNGRATLHDELEAGRIIVKKGIEKLTENGIIFTDDNGKEIKVDVVVFATGYKQQASFLDPKVVDLRFQRKGNDVKLYKYVFPTSEYDNIGFINLAQTITFLCSDLQSRAFLEVFQKRIKLPSREVMENEIQAVRRTLNAQYIDRSQLRVQGGANYLYYEDLAEFVGCNPNFWKIMTERPTAIWHAFFVTWCSLQYRLVGPGRYEIAEKWIEERYNSRYYSPFFPNGEKKRAPSDRGGLIGLFRRAQGVLVLLIIRGICLARGMSVGPKIQNFLEGNLRYAKEDMEKRGIHHAIEEDDGAEPSDYKQYQGKISVWGKQ